MWSIEAYWRGMVTNFYYIRRIESLGEFVHNNTKPLFRLAGHFWTNTKYSGEESWVISVDIHRELTQCVRTWIFSKCQKHWDFTLCPSSTVGSTFTQGNIYNRLRFLNKYLMFLEELKELFQENWSKSPTAGYLVFWKQFPAAWYLDTSNILTCIFYVS